MYREDCGDSRQVQLTIKKDKRWLEMARKEYGPMKAMMLGRLKFEGPGGVAMKNMGPFLMMRASVLKG